jgi:hypothetical protein
MKDKSVNQLKTNLYFKKLIAVGFIVVLVLITVFTIYGLIAEDDKILFLALLAVVATSWSFLPLPFSAIERIKTEIELKKDTI